MALNPNVGVATRLGVAQTLAWASTYYLPAMLAEAMAREFGISVPWVFAAFSAALIVAALLGPYSGGLIDRYGGKPVLVASSVVFALGLACLGMAQGPLTLLAAWLIIGIGMGCGLYEAAFSTLVGLYGHKSRGVITGITLIAGFASTVGWPLSTYLELHIGWRGACLAWAALHLTLGLGLNLSLPKRTTSHPDEQSTYQDDARGASDVGAAASRRWASVALAFVFAATWFISTAMAAHLPRLLMAGGATLATAVFVGALIGPAQVAARLLEFGLLRNLHPLLSARLAASLHPIGALAFGLVGAPAAAAFGILHGAGNGILTIAKGTLPLTIFGPAGYGGRQGWLMAPARLAQALAPWLFGLCLDKFGVGALWLSSALAIAALLMLMSLQAKGGTCWNSNCARE